MQDPRLRPPAERCLRALWGARLPFLAIIFVFVAAAAAITAAQRTLYASRAILSIKPAPEIVAEAIRTNRPQVGPDGRLYDANDPLRQSGPGRYAPRLAAPGLVTEAARDAGLLTKDQALDDRRAAEWVTTEAIEGADLVRLTAWQPTADAAQRLAAAIVARGLEANRRDEAEVVAPEVRRRLTLVDPPTRPDAPSFPRTDVNLSVGLALGVLAASAFVAIRSTVCEKHDV
jgi:uncharacterized protein involved in exopolysaccharide biosynthesis